MNANDLAIYLDATSSDMEYNYHVSDWKLLSDAAEMLRQQQAEIEALKKEAALQRLSDFTQEVEKTLTDDEINKVLEPFTAVKFEFNKPTPEFDYLGFAKAILRKAQEK